MSEQESVMSYTFEVNESDFDEKVVNSEGIIILDMWAEWCGPCLALAPTLDRLAETFPGKVRIAKLNVGYNPGIAVRYGVRSIPTILFFKDGEKKDYVIGNLPYKVFEDKLKKLL